jgi:outer membrane receptor protein involved in Fe transport
LGFRYDFFLQSSEIRSLEALETQTETAVMDTRSKVSPRIGVSYPISDKAKVYFNYGHFYQLPELHYMYMQTTQLASQYSQFGNYNLDYMKQIQYDLGVEYAIAANYKATLSGFYKDIYGQMNTERVQVGPKTYSYWKNMDYGRTRGLELELSKMYGGYISGYVNYQYAYAYGKSSMEASNYYQTNPEKISIKEYPLDWDVRHQLTMNFDLRVPEDEHPELFGFKMPDSWGVNVIYQFRSGYPYTPEGKLPGYELPVGQDDPTPNSRRMPSYSNVDLRFNKDFKVWKLSYSFMLWVINVLDDKNISEVWASTGRANTNQNFFDQSFNENVVYSGKDLDQDPLRYLPGRNIKVGLSVNF